MSGLPSDSDVDAYITQRAKQLGIDPDIAVAISRKERGPRSGGWIGDQGSSFGPYNLHLGGISHQNPGAGLGDVFRTQTHLDPRDIGNTWKQQVDFSLEYARDKSGWEPFHAAAALGYGIWDGIRSAVGNAASKLKYVFPIAGYSADPHKTYHTSGATDLFAPRGTPVRDIADGRVTMVSSSGPGGNNLIIKGFDGLDYYYAHLDGPPSVNAGDYVAAGQTIGKVGNTGNAASTEPHLHLGIGYGIASGTGPTGGAGQNFNAQDFLSQILTAGGAAQTGEGVVVNTANTLTSGGPGIYGAAMDIGKSVQQGLQNYVQDRAASIVLLTLGILLVIAGVIGWATQSETVRNVVSTATKAAAMAA